MKKLIIAIAAIFVSIESFAQVQPDQLPEITSFNGGDVLITQQEDGVVRKFDYSFLESQIVPDELDLYWDSTEVKTYTNDNFIKGADVYWTKDGNYVYNLNDSVGIGKDTATERLDVDGNVNVGGQLYTDTINLNNSVIRYNEFTNNTLYIEPAGAGNDYLYLSEDNNNLYSSEGDNYSSIFTTNTQTYNGGAFGLEVSDISNTSYIEGNFSEIKMYYDDDNGVKNDMYIDSSGFQFDITGAEKLQITQDTTFINNILELSDDLIYNLGLWNFISEGSVGAISGNDMQLQKYGPVNSSEYFLTHVYDTVANKTQTIINGSYPDFPASWYDFRVSGTSYFSDTLKTVYLKAPDGDHEGHIGSFSRLDTMNYATADTWKTVELDTAYDNQTTAGFELNADSTAIIANFTGTCHIGGHVHVKNNASTTTATVYLRFLRNGVELEQFNLANTRRWQGDAFIDMVSADGFVHVDSGDEISIQFRATDADFDLESTNGGVFDKTVPVTLWFSQGVNK